MCAATQPQPLLAIVGATAAGKSDKALDLAARIGGEVVNTDAMQVYVGMDIGTAKLPVSQRRDIPHHLIDILCPDQEASVAEFQRLARAAIEEIHARQKVPILVGGSALYTRAVLDRIDFPGTDPQLRAALERELAEVGPEALHARLAELDPPAASRIEPLNGRRIVRALEVIELTGSFTATMPAPAYHRSGTVQLGVDIDRPTVDTRIALRVERMWADGFLDEVRRLGPPERLSRTANRAIGYAQAWAQLAGELTEAEAKERTVIATRRFVRRQDAWFRKDDRVHWFGYDLDWSDPAVVPEELLRG